MEQETNGVETSEIKGGLDTALFAVERGPRTKLQIFDVSIQRVLTELRVICPTGDLVLFRPEVSLANGCIYSELGCDFVHVKSMKKTY